VVEQALGEGGDLLGGEIESPAADFDPRRRELPVVVRDAERVEEPRPQIVPQPHAGRADHRRSQQVSRSRVVTEMRPRLEGRSSGEKRLFPVCGGSHVVHRAVVVAAVHRQQVADAHPLELFIEVLRQLVRKQVDQPGVKRKFPLGAGEPDRARGEAFAQREEHVRQLRRIRFLPRLGDHAAVPHDHQAVDGIEFVERPEKGEQRGGGDPLRLRRGTRQNPRHDTILPAKNQL